MLSSEYATKGIITGKLHSYDSFMDHIISCFLYLYAGPLLLYYCLHDLPAGQRTDRLFAHEFIVVAARSNPTRL